VNVKSDVASFQEQVEERAKEATDTLFKLFARVFGI
jgi:hypothetical protein